MDESLSIGTWLKTRRKGLDMTQAQLAEAASCSVETIRKVESGGLRPSRQLAELLAACLGVPPEERADFIRFARWEPDTPSPLPVKSFSPRPS